MPEENMTTVGSIIGRHAAERPDETFLIGPETGSTISFADLKRNADEIGRYLDLMRIAPGSKAAFMLDNGIWSAQLFLGIMASGRIVVPLNVVAGTTHLEHVLGHSDSEVVFIAPRYRELLDELLERMNREIAVVTVDPVTGPAWPMRPGKTAATDPPSAGDSALLLYTSGSTGLPKGALLSQRAIVSGGRNVVTGHGLAETDRVLCVLPVYHINGAMVTVVAPLTSGGSVVMPDRFSARAFWSQVAEFRCTWSSVVPTIIKYLLDRSDEEEFEFGSDGRLSRFRFARSASAPLPAVVMQQWESTFRVPMIETLGLTETAGTVASNPMPPAPRKAGSVGISYGNDIRIVDDDGRERPDGTSGEMVVRGSNVLDGYYKNPEATAAGFFGDWFRTGDIAYRDADGYLFITGRIKELIIRGGENIAPREIDDVLYRHEAILEAAAVGVDDDSYGQEVVACVVVRDGHSCTEEELKAFCEQAVGRVKAPKRIYFMDDLPKGPSGKIFRLRLPALIP
ncbi:MAG: AMP-binding protein [Gammaproteobacteria bacterium]|nr:AMP-binding protein [Gammaproteobacteria bacterium]MYD76672.1 AMP-binding protein [Gammaproteobacteria bacterium]MYJ52110.1 AMP-binding protein [Gammaproteobacteria bacterium]